MTELEILRKKIDEIDRKLLPLFLERMECTTGVAEYKRKNNMPVLDKNRERDILQNKVCMVNEELKETVYSFYSSIMAISRADQIRRLNRDKNELKLDEHFGGDRLIENPIVAYQGTEGAYSETALMKFFGDNTKRINVMSFEEVFKTISEGKADYGVLPLENSQTGSITEVYDLLAKNNFYIVGETDVPIVHFLVGLDGASIGDIKTVYSHEQGFMQSKEFFKDYPCIEFKPYYNTAMSAEMVAKSGDITKAAIASRRAAELYGLKVLAENINQSSKNTTRFAVIAKRGIINEKCNKISAVFTLPDESGTLSGVMSVFAACGVNMAKIESRPGHQKNFEYMFFVDFEGNLLRDKDRRFVCDIMEQTSSFKLLGNYEFREE